MKKLMIVICAFCAIGLALSGCSGKNPVGPSSMLSLGSNATSGTSSTTSSGGGSTNTSNSGNTSVDTTPINTVSTQTGDTGVSGAEASTGVNSGISGGSTSSLGGGSNASSGGTLSVVLSATTQVVFPNLNLSPGSAPTIAWTFSGISGVKMIEVLVSNPQSPTYTPAWDVYFPCSTPYSVTYGVAPSGAYIANAPITLAKGNYSVLVHAYDGTNRNTAMVITVGIGTLTVK